MNATRMLLGIEAAIGGGSLALAEHGLTIAAWSGEGVARAEAILPEVDALLKEAGVAGPELDAIVVSAGPGSFTGVRIGMAIALGLSKAWSAEILRVDLLEAMSTGRVVKVAVLPVGRGMFAVRRPDATVELGDEASTSALLLRESANGVAAPAGTCLPGVTELIPNLAEILVQAALTAEIRTDCPPIFLSKPNG